MYEGATVGVVIAAYNEQGFVGDVIETVPVFVDHVYVVDDGSTDDTWNEIRDTFATIDSSESNRDRIRPRGDGSGMGWRDRIVARDERGNSQERRFVAIRHKTNTGVGGAIKTGYRAALGDDVDVVAVMAGDGQMDPDILDRIIDPVVRGDFDYAKGNRLRNAEYRRNMSVWRTFGNFLLTYLTRLASGYWRMMDPQNGYTAISRESLKRIELDTLYEDYGFCNHVLVRLNKHGLRVADVSMRAIYGDESSHIRYRKFIPALSLLLMQSYLSRLLDADARTATTISQLLGMCVFLGGALLGIGSVFLSVPAGATSSGVLWIIGAVLFLAGIAVEWRDNANMEVKINPTNPPWALDVGPGATYSTDDSSRRKG